MNFCNPEVYCRALEFAARAHHGQAIPGSDLPYVSHVVQVAMEIMQALLHTPGLDADLAVQCALLHDTLEDTPTTLAQLAGQFGERVATGVLALSKDPALPKADQMADSLRRIVAHSPEARLVKLADRTNNLRQPPHYWTTDKKIAYRDEALVILQTLGRISPFMEQRLAEQIAGYARYF
jgi:(p)ppGpp synthase/HD superfamily hydrolase